ncbi:Hsp20 family protein [Asticcacaulis solisilvae]|uniref:Hsp20 family protein n=1 Tax=Asticcacaulis solisilvae TaxID=1217274 RepID=UPI003FD7F0FA
MTRSISFSPLFGSSIGFDRFDDLFDTLTRTSDEGEGQPSYNIERHGDDDYTITLAVAGFSESDLAITVQDSTLLISGERKPHEAKSQYLYKGIGLNDFQRRFRLADYVVVKSAELKDGLLKVSLAREVPDDQKPRRIEIRTRPELKAIEKAPQKVA